MAVRGRGRGLSPSCVACRTAGKDRDAAWLSLLSQTSLTQIDRSSFASFATT